MKRIMLSLVLPVYNVELYIEKCINSIINQEQFDMVELILIDDGSTDNSGKICAEYSKKYKNIKTYHKLNGGLSDARNFGFNKSKGDYVFFIDSDDELAPGAIKKIIKIIEQNKTDIILFDADCIDENEKKITCKYNFIHEGLKENKIYSGEEIIFYQLTKKHDYLTTVWLGVYKAEFLKQNGLFFEVGLLHEDELWTPKVLLSANRIIYINKIIYSYRIRNNSIMRDGNKNNRKHIEALIYIFTTLYSYFEFKIKDISTKTLVLDNLSKRYLHAITKYRFDDFPELLKLVNSRMIFAKSKTPKNTMRALLLRLNKKLYCIITRRKKLS